MSDIIEINGLTLDIARAGHVTVYWTDAQTRRIEMCDMDGRNRFVVVYTDLLAPRGIVLDQVNRLIYSVDIIVYYIIYIVFSNFFVCIIRNRTRIHKLFQ